jgi:hypothetical protein
MMLRSWSKAFWVAAALGALQTSAFAQAAAPTPWELKSDTGYGYDKAGKTFSYKMGTNNAGLLLTGAKKVPRATASSCSGQIEGAKPVITREGG